MWMDSAANNTTVITMIALDINRDAIGTLVSIYRIGIVNNEMNGMNDVTFTIVLSGAFVANVAAK